MRKFFEPAQNTFFAKFRFEDDKRGQRVHAALPRDCEFGREVAVQPRYYLYVKAVAVDIIHKNITSEKAYAITSYSDGTVSTFLIEKISGKIEVTTIDTFNIVFYSFYIRLNYIK